MKIITIENAVKLIKDKSNIIITGFGNHHIPNNILLAIKNSYLNNNHPSNINLITGISAGNLSLDDVGLNTLAIPNLVDKIITSHMGMSKKMANLIYENQIKAYTIPLGVYLQLLKTNNNVITKIGLNTFCDPRLDKAMANDLTKQDNQELVSLININNQEYLSYKPFDIDVCIIKASIVDKYGNISYTKQDIIDDSYDAIIATHNKGGIVIVETNNLVDKIDNSDIIIPNMFIDYVIVVEDNNKKEETNLIKKDEKRDIIGKRASLELKKNSIINIGVGMPESIFKYIKEEDNIIVTLESGFIGGNIKTGVDFGLSTNYKARLKMSDMLNLYNSNFLDIAFLGAAQVDKNGCVNVSKFGSRAVGPGGFIDIVSNCKKIVFMTTLTNKKNEAKFKNEIEQITFSNKLAIENNIEVLYITEACVFKLTPKGLLLTEIDNNLTINDILNKMEFIPNIDASLLAKERRND